MCVPVFASDPAVGAGLMRPPRAFSICDNAHGLRLGALFQRRGQIHLAVRNSSPLGGGCVHARKQCCMVGAKGTVLHLTVLSCLLSVVSAVVYSSTHNVHRVAQHSILRCVAHPASYEAVFADRSELTCPVRNLTSTSDTVGPASLARSFTVLRFHRCTPMAQTWEGALNTH